MLLSMALSKIRAHSYSPGTSLALPLLISLFACTYSCGSAKTNGLPLFELMCGNCLLYVSFPFAGQFCTHFHTHIRTLQLFMIDTAHPAWGRSCSLCSHSLQNAAIMPTLIFKNSIGTGLSSDIDHHRLHRLHRLHRRRSLHPAYSRSMSEHWEYSTCLLFFTVRIALIMKAGVGWTTTPKGCLTVFMLAQTSSSGLGGCGTALTFT